MSSESLTHRIRLRGPWEYAWLDGAADPESQEPQIVTMPVPWQDLFGERSGTALFQRRFNRPSNLEPEQRVRIVLSQPHGEVTLRLNGERIPVTVDADETFLGDVTDQLQDFNVLEVQMTCDVSEDSDALAGLWQPVVLEITE